MEAYRQTLKVRLALLAALEIAAFVLLAYSLDAEAARKLPDFLRGFQSGLASGIGIAALVFLVRFGWILQDPKRLRLQYIKETDERNKAIRAKAGMPLLWVTSVGMILAGMIGGYWNPMIF